MAQGPIPWEIYANVFGGASLGLRNEMLFLSLPHHYL